MVTLLSIADHRHKMWSITTYHPLYLHKLCHLQFLQLFISYVFVNTNMSTILHLCLLLIAYCTCTYFESFHLHHACFIPRLCTIAVNFQLSAQWYHSLEHHQSLIDFLKIIPISEDIWYIIETLCEYPLSISSWKYHLSSLQTTTPVSWRALWS